MPQGCCECSAVFFIHVACGLLFSSQNAKVLQNKCHQPHAVHGRSRYIPGIIGWLFWHVGIPARWIPWMGVNQNPIFSWITLVVFPGSGLHTFEPTFFWTCPFFVRPGEAARKPTEKKKSRGKKAKALQKWGIWMNPIFPRVSLRIGNAWKTWW